MLVKSISEISLSVSSGLTPLRTNTEFWDNASIPWLKTEQLGEKYVYDTNEHISDQALAKTSIKVNPVNTLSIAMYGEGKTRGRVSILKSAMATNQACCNIVLNPDKADAEFLYYYLVTQYDQLRNLSSGVRKNLNSKDIKQFDVRLPTSVKEQQKLVKVLSQLDNKIELNNRINAELEAMAKTLYDYWFVQFDFPDASGQPYKTSGGKMVWNEHLKREIPAGWEVSALDSWIASDKSGDWGKADCDEKYSLEIKCIRGADINGLNGLGDFSPPSRFILPKNTHKLISENDVVVEISGGSPKQSTGRSALVTLNVLQRFNVPLVSSNFCKAVALNERFRAYEFSQMWNALYSHGVFFGWEGKTSGIKNLQFDAFVRSHSAPMAPEKLSRKFASLSELVDKKRQMALEENMELVKLRDWLLPMLMNGQVTVGD